MKKLFVVDAIPASFCATAALGKIPAKITSAFQARYASAANVEWQHSLRRYKASFDLGEFRFKTMFDHKGNWLGSEKMIGSKELPVAVKSSLQKSKYGEWEIKASYERYVPHERPSYHVIAAKGDFKRKELVFNDQGRLING